jgi:hypothetical protein
MPDYQEFWSCILGALSDVTPHYQEIRPPSGNYVSRLINHAGFHLCVGEHYARIEIYGKAPPDKSGFDLLYRHRSQIEVAFGHPLEWERLEEQPNWRVKFEIVANAANTAEWSYIEAFYLTFTPRFLGAVSPILRRIAPEVGGLIALPE